MFVQFASAAIEVRLQQLVRQNQEFSLETRVQLAAFWSHFKLSTNWANYHGVVIYSWLNLHVLVLFQQFSSELC